MTQGRGNKKTYERLVKLLNAAVFETSQSAVARGTGLTQSAVHRYLKGIGEPSTASLQKIAEYFGVSVPWLRGGIVGCRERLLEGMKLLGLCGEDFNKATKAYGEKESDEYWSKFILGELELDRLQFEKYCHLFGINAVWVISGLEPSKHENSGVVGTIIPIYDPVFLTRSRNAEPFDNLPFVVCAKCKTQLKPGRLASTFDGQNILEYWPCENCCN